MSESDFRPLGVEGFTPLPPPTDLGAVPMLQWLPIADLVVDESYQREMKGAGRRNVIAIARAFQWIKFSPVVVSPVAGGKFAVIDGQHRTTAALLLGITTVPCQVVVADRARQAEAFAAINGQSTRVGKLHVFGAQLAAGDPEARAVADACAVAGVTILRSPKGAGFLGKGETVAVAALEAIHRLYGRDTLVTALQCVTETSNNVPGILTACVIKSIGMVLGDHPDWRDAGGVLLDAFDTIDLETGQIEARSKAARMRGVVASDLLQAAIIEHLEQQLGAKERAA